MTTLTLNDKEILDIQILLNVMAGFTEMDEEFGKTVSDLRRMKAIECREKSEELLKRLYNI